MAPRLGLRPQDGRRSFADTNASNGTGRELGKKIATCLVKGISTNGARLEVDSPEKLRDCFRLNHGGDKQPKCSVRWRNGREMGVQFLLQSPLRPRKSRVSRWPALAEFLSEALR